MSSQDETAAALEAARVATSSALEVAETAGTGTDLVPTGADAAVAVKARMAGAHAQVARARKAALEKVTAAREAIKAQQAELDRQARAMELELAPLMDQLELMREGIWTMNLYLGRDEEIVQIAEGAPAPASTPIHVRQQVLAMDEESAINAEGGGIDFRNIEEFDDWVTADPSHLDQLLPEKRGVVAVMARRSEIDYKDVWANVHFNAKNKHTYWLIRNGENVYRMDTEFETGPRLVPARNEFTSIFVDRWTKKPLQPGTDAWLKAEKEAGARERHFMRVALILQGLCDRTHVFAPLPKAGVSLLSPEDYDAGHVVLIADDENQITTGRTPFYEWLRALNTQLRTGMRVMIATRHSNYDHDRVHPANAENPKSGEVYTIKRPGSRAGEFVVTYKRTVETWVNDGWGGGGEFRVPMTSASYTLRTDDRFVLPIDLVDIATMRTYLAARTERHAYADMFPTLTAAIEFLEAEQAAEAPFRELLAAQVAQTEDVDLDVAAARIDDVIRTWKVGNRWFRPMSGDAETEARAAREILAERARIVAANAGAGDDAAFLARARREHPDALLIARKKDGTYVVLTPAKRAWTTAANGKAQQGMPFDVWMHQHEYTRTGKPRAAREWVIPQMSSVARWIVLHEGPKWATWKRTARPVEHLTDPEILDAIEQIRSKARGMDLLAITFDEATRRWSSKGRPEFSAWYHPGPVAGTDRPLTKPVGGLSAYRLDIRVIKDKDGAVTLEWYRGIDPMRGSEQRWERPHWFHDEEAPADKSSTPLGYNYASEIVWIDEDVMAAGRRAEAAVAAARKVENDLERVVHTLMDSVQQEWIDRFVAGKKVTFMDDYADEDLWAEEEKRLREKVRVPWLHSQPQYGIRYAVRRLVETDQAPWGLTVREAVELLDEPLDPNTGARGFQQHGRRSNTLEEPLPDELLDLRFAYEPTGTDIALRKDA
jgi:hypothetical protein